MTKSQAAALAAFQADSDLEAARSRLGEALPTTGWLHDYLAAVTPLTDAPVEFSLASGMCALSAALGNALWYETWGQMVYPHIWAVLVAPSSFWRKSTAINMAERLLREAEDARVLPADFSREKILEELAARPVGMLTLKEFGGFLERLGATYMAGTKEMLTDLYDGPDRYTRALKTKSYSIERPAVTLLAATTLDWLESKITDGDLRSGFLARFLFVTATEKSSPKGLTGGMDGMARMHLRDALRDLTKVTPGPATLTADARAMYDDWMSGWQAEVESVRHASDLTGFAVRLQTYALKFAMCFQASDAVMDGSPVDVLGIDPMQRAIAYARLLWSNVAALVDEEIAIGRDAKELRRLKQLVGPGTTRSNLLRLSKLKARDFDEYLKTLVGSGELVQERRKASELGIERQRDTTFDWLRPGAFGRLGFTVSVPRGGDESGTAGTTGNDRNSKSELEAGTLRVVGNSNSELEGPDSRSESLPVPSSLSSLTHSDESAGTRARARYSKPTVDSDLFQ